MPRIHLRLALSLDLNDVAAQLTTEYDTAPDTVRVAKAFVPSYNIGQTSAVPVLRRGPGAEEALVLHTMRWGLLPHWRKLDDMSIPVLRAETVCAGTNSVGLALRMKHRCVVVCEGFYVWCKVDKKDLRFYWKDPEGRLLLLAGLYDFAMVPGEQVQSCALLYAKEPKDEAYRTPMVLRNNDALHAWLDTSSLQWTDALGALVAAGTQGTASLSKCQVRDARSRSSSPSMTADIAVRKDGIAAAFARQAASASQASQADASTPGPSQTARRLNLRPAPPSPRSPRVAPKRRSTRIADRQHGSVREPEAESEPEVVEVPRPKRGRRVGVAGK